MATRPGLNMPGNEPFEQKTSRSGTLTDHIDGVIGVRSWLRETTKVHASPCHESALDVARGSVATRVQHAWVAAEIIVSPSHPSTCSLNSQRLDLLS